MLLFNFSVSTYVRKSIYGHLLWPGVLCGIRVVLDSSFLQAYGLSDGCWTQQLLVFAVASPSGLAP